MYSSFVFSSIICFSIVISFVLALKFEWNIAPTTREVTLRQLLGGCFVFTIPFELVGGILFMLNGSPRVGFGLLVLFYLSLIRLTINGNC